MPLLKRKPGALRDGSTFHQRQIPAALQTLKQHDLKRPQSDKDCVQLLLLIDEYGMEEGVTACE